MYREPGVWHALMEKLADAFAATSRAQGRRRARTRSSSSTPGSACSRVADYEEFVAPYSARILAAVDVPTIHFGTGTSHLLAAMAAAGGDAIGLDWRVPLDEGWLAVGPERAVQGNLDPAVLLGPWERVEAAALDVLDRAGGRPGHVFNLGHGVLPADRPGRPRPPRRARARAHGEGGRVSAAVVLMAYGSPERIEDVPAYYADIRGGRPIRPELLDELTERYRRLGIEDSNPLNEITERTRAALEQELGLPVFTGMKHWTPRIARRGRGRARGGRGDDRRARARAALLAAVDRRLPRAARGGARRPRRAAVRRELARRAGASSSCSRTASAARTRTSSSPRTRLPARILDEGDPVPGRSCSRPRRLVARTRGARATGRSASSPSRRPASPGSARTSSTTSRRSTRRASTDVLVCPIGFVADHLEIRWDLDTEAQEKARELGLRLERIEMPNDDPAFVAVLAAIVRRALAVPSAT